MNTERKYYQLQSVPAWDRQKSEFELKLQELRQAKQDLLSQKQNILSPRRLSTLNSKTIEELQVLLVLKEEENFSLTGIISAEKEKVRNLTAELIELKEKNKFIEEQLKIKESAIQDLEKSIGKYFNQLSIMKLNLSKWVGSGSVKSILSPKASQNHSTSKSEFLEPKHKEENNLNNYLFSPTNTEQLKEDWKTEIKHKEQEILSLREELQSNDKKNKEKISVLVSEIERLRESPDTSQVARSRITHSCSNSRNFDDYENNLKILNENVKLLQEKIKSLEAEKLLLLRIAKEN